MISSGLVRAQVVDIRSRKSSLPKNIAVDTNILFFTYFDFTVLSPRVTRPRSYQTTKYPQWWGEAVSGNVQICTSSNCLAEFALMLERVGLEVLWTTDPNRPDFDYNNPGQNFSAKYAKPARYHYLSQLEAVRSEVKTTLQSVLKTVAVLPQVGQESDVFGAAFNNWASSTSDFGDAVLVTAAKRAGMPRIISDDADFVTFDGITLYTANERAIDAASQAGKLTT